MAAGLRACGIKVSMIEESRWAGTTDGDVAVFYGLEGNTPAIFEHYRTTPGLHAVYIDLGYWGRREGGRWTGYHKVVVNNRHPTEYLMTTDRPADRFGRFGIEVKPWRLEGDHILVAGMGDKGARAEGFEPEEWERQTITELRRHTNRPILYRPKPSWKEAKPIEGTRYSHRDVPVERELQDCWAVVTHHSNVAVDALLAGIPAICVGGVARMLTGSDLEAIRHPPRPAGREQWAANLAYTQWSIAEMALGLPWMHLTRECLV